MNTREEGTVTTGLPVPRFKVGDTVWMARADETHKTAPCPDCQGTGQWAALTAAGETIAVECPRCARYSRTKLPSLTRRIKTVSVQRLTIGSVRTRFDSDHPGLRDAISYMCIETGVGSGNVYHEGRDDRGLYATEQEATEVSERVRVAEQAELDQTPQALQAVHYASKPMDTALKERYWNELWGAWRRAQQLCEVIDGVLDDEDVQLPEEVSNTLSDARQDRSWHTPHPLKAVIAAAEALLQVTGSANDILVVPRIEWCALRDAVDVIKGPVDG